MSILVVGSAAFDSVITKAGKRENVLGGSAVYFSVAASYFSKVNLVAVVGRDFPSSHVKFLQKRGINTQGIERKNGLTFRWKGRYKGRMNVAETLKTCLNVFKDFHPKLPEDFKNSKYVFLANIDPDLQDEVLSKIKSPRLIASDTMNFWIMNKKQSLKKVMKKIDLLFINEEEACSFTGESDILYAAKGITKMGPDTVVIKMGKFGALIFSKDRVFMVPAFPLESVVDPTGAGDSFAGGFMGYISKTGRTTERAMRNAMLYGTVMASFTVEDFSINRYRKITSGEINQRYRRLKKMSGVRDI